VALNPSGSPKSGKSGPTVSDFESLTTSTAGAGESRCSTSAPTSCGGASTEEELGHLTAKPVVLGGAEGVVGEARGAQPEWIAKVRISNP
jgi:hypothetical protein